MILPEPCLHRHTIITIFLHKITYAHVYVCVCFTQLHHQMPYDSHPKAQQEEIPALESFARTQTDTKALATLPSPADRHL